VITSIWPFAAIALGVPLAFWVTHKVIGLVTRHAR
jgi:hypothetical protein